MVSEAIRQRFLRDPWRIRLGNLASDLARIASSNNAEHEYVASLLAESKCFAEWTAPEVAPNIEAMLTQLQRTIESWEQAWIAGAPVATMRSVARSQSDKLLKLAGFDVAEVS